MSHNLQELYNLSELEIDNKININTVDIKIPITNIPKTNIEKTNLIKKYLNKENKILNFRYCHYEEE